MSAVEATYFDGRTSAAHAVQLTSCGEQLTVAGIGWTRCEAHGGIRVTTRLAGTHRTLALPDGAQLQVRDNDAVDGWFPRRNRLEALVDRLERHAAAVATALLVTILSVTWGIFYGLPLAAEHVAGYIPDSVVARMGEETSEMLPRFGFDDSHLTAGRQQELQDLFAGFAQRTGDRKHYRLLFFHATEGIGANAFALPGGTLVITDQLVDLFKNDEQFLAVLAHEIGHEEHRHLLRSVLQGSGVALFSALLTGEVSSAGAIVVAIPTFLLNNHYSRAFESEADDYAFAALAAQGISPGRFAEVMQLLQKNRLFDERGADYLSTHPPTFERILRAEQAAEEYKSGHSR